MSSHPSNNFDPCQNPIAGKPDNTRVSRGQRLAEKIYTQHTATRLQKMNVTRRYKRYNCYVYLSQAARTQSYATRRTRPCQGVALRKET